MVFRLEPRRQTNHLQQTNHFQQAEPSSSIRPQLNRSRQERILLGAMGPRLPREAVLVAEEYR